jgi:APA family basic amino acid/polyamine antiporter
MKENTADKVRTAQIGLKKFLGPIDGAALVVSNMIGVGIFTCPGIVARLVPIPSAILSVWIVGGVFALFGAMAYGRLSAVFPKAGGEYIYLRRTLGSMFGFLAGWTSFIAGFLGAIAASAIALASYLNGFIHLFLTASPPTAEEAFLPGKAPLPQTLLAILAIVALSAIHAFGGKSSRRVQNLLAFSSVGVILILIIAGLSRQERGIEHAQPRLYEFSNWLLALVPVMFTYSGWNAAVYLAEEVHGAERNVRKALLIGTACVICIYSLLNIVYLRVLPVNLVADSMVVGESVSSAVFGTRGAVFIDAVLILVLTGSISAMILAGSRVYFAMARDGLFPRSVGEINSWSYTPTTAIVVQALWASILVLTGTFENLLIYTGFSVVLFSGIAVFCLFVLEKRHVIVRLGWLYRIAAGAFVAFCVVLVGNAVLTDPIPSTLGILLIAAGIPLFKWFNYLRRTESETAIEIRVNLAAPSKDT